MQTIRELLAKNASQGRQPKNVVQLAKISGISRPTIIKMQDGHYGRSKPSSIEQVFREGFAIEVVVRDPVKLVAEVA